MSKQSESARQELHRLLGAAPFIVTWDAPVTGLMARSAARQIVGDARVLSPSDIEEARKKLLEVGRNAAVELLNEVGYEGARRERALLVEAVKQAEASFSEEVVGELVYSRHVVELVGEWLQRLEKERGLDGTITLADLPTEEAAPWYWSADSSDYAMLMVSEPTLADWGVKEDGEAFLLWNLPTSVHKVRKYLQRYKANNEIRFSRSRLRAKASSSQTSPAHDLLMFRVGNLSRVLAEYELYGIAPKWDELSPGQRDDVDKADVFIRRRNAMVGLLVERDSAGLLRQRKGVRDWDAKTLFEQMASEDTENAKPRSIRKRFCEQLQNRFDWWENPGTKVEPFTKYALEVARHRDEIGRPLID